MTQSSHAAPSVEALVRPLIDAWLLAPVDERGDRRWCARELAIAAEGCLRERRSGAELDQLDARTWADWRTRLACRFDFPSYEDAQHSRRWSPAKAQPFWLLDGRQRVGAVGLRPGDTPDWLEVGCLFVDPEDRKRGHAARLLRLLLCLVAAEGGAGLGLSTQWGWRHTLRFYLAQGFWIESWAPSLRLVLPVEERSWSYSITGPLASFSVQESRRPRLELLARRDGRHLELLEPNPETSALRDRALATFSVCLALDGFPLTSRRPPDPADPMSPGHLSRRIVQLQTLDAEHGFLARPRSRPAPARWGSSTPGLSA